MESGSHEYTTSNEALAARDKGALDKFELGYLTCMEQPYWLVGHTEFPLDNHPRATGFLVTSHHGRCIIWENVDQCDYCSGSGVTLQRDLTGQPLPCPYCNGIGDFAPGNDEPTMRLTDEAGQILATGNNLAALIYQVEHPAA